MSKFSGRFIQVSLLTVTAGFEDNAKMNSDPTPRALAMMIRESAPLLLRFLRGFDETNRTIQLDGLPNHPTWILGHCAFSMARLTQFIGGAVPSEDDFSVTLEPKPTRYFIESIAKNSKPVDDPDRYPTLARGREIFENAIEKLACTLERTHAERLSSTIDWNGEQRRIDAMAMRICFHNGMHAGQLTDLRRALKFDRVLP